MTMAFQFQVVRMRDLSDIDSDFPGSNLIEQSACGFVELLP